MYISYEYVVINSNSVLRGKIAVTSIVAQVVGS
jgi:hypothetical protein